MSATRFLAFVLGALIVGLAAELLVVLGRKARTNALLRRAEVARAAARPFVVGLVAGEPGDWPPGRTGDVAEALAVDMLRKVRGEARASIVEALEGRGAVERAIRRSRSWWPLRRAQAAELLGAIGVERALPLLADMLADRSPVVRRVAARAVGAVGSEAGAVPLLASLAGRRALPAGVVGRALARIGPSAAPALQAALTDPSGTTRLLAAQLLGHLEVLDAAPDLARALGVEELPEVRAELARTLGRIGAPLAVPALLDVLAGDDDEAVRAAAARALGRIGVPAAVPVLRQAITEPGYEVPHASAQALHELGLEGRTVLVDAVSRGEAGADHAAEALALGAVRQEAKR